MMFVKLSTKIVKLMAPESGLWVLGYDQNGHIVKMYNIYIFRIFLVVGDKLNANAL